MWRKLPRQQFCSPVFSVIRQHLLPNFNNAPQSRNSLVFSSYLRENHRVCQISKPQLLVNAKFFGRNICSDSCVTTSCWNCNAVAASMNPFLVCQSCRAVQPVDHSIDYFHIFSLKKKFDIDDINLERKYKDWQKKLHPDFVHSKSKEEREHAAEQSGRMRLEGVEVDDEKTVTESELLSEIMEIREAVEEAADPRH
ncbi:iron-sulfur cluster co-chaperone protein HscB-like [Heracleum sosnowskyi]|uniref:Iron-sulfur cluster co-chaperone protein HscB-like n=1 Tax=Heracleum sosnowskyi TaxID=360622 RepID=A0AAD8IL19_9APIA|nr:iron-sulfur cluster co-chaperone protein HscB-like [Heracleum sosnowskyi]